MRAFCVLILLIGVNWTLAQNLGKIHRGKRQITDDGVPIIDGSYFDGDNRPAARFFSQFERPEPQPPHFPELSSRNSRPQLRSLDGGDDLDWQNGFQESSRTRKTFKRRTSRKSIQVKSSDGDVHSEIPHFSEEVTYRRSNNADDRQDQQRSTQLRSLHSSSDRSRSNGISCVTSRCAPAAASMYDEGRGDLQVRSLDTSSDFAGSSAVRAGRESEGLRLYSKLIEGGSRRRSQNQLRSLDSGSSDWMYSQGRNQRRSSASSASSSQDSTTQMHLRSGQPIPSEVMSSAGLHSGELYYRRSTGDRRRSGSNSAGQRSLGSTSASSSSRTRSLSSSSSRSAQSTSQNQGSSSLSCLNNCRSSSSSTLVAPQTQTILRSLPSSSSLGSSSSWAEKEERSHSSSRSISHTVNGVETNGLGKPYESQEEATYRREASGGDGLEPVNQVHSESRRENNIETRSLQSTSQIVERQRQHQEEEQRPTPAPAPTLSVGNYQRKRLNCSLITATTLDQGAQTAAQFLATPPPCLQPRRRSNCQTCQTQSQQLETRSRDERDEMVYPVLQQIGQGDDQVHARVLSSSDNDQQSMYESGSNGGQRQEVSYSSGGRTRKGYYRRTVFKNYTTSEHPGTIETWLS